jgi:hypothetical protein
VIAFMAGVMGDFTERITIWSTLNNPFFAGPRADLLSMIPFVLVKESQSPGRAGGIEM